MYRVALILFCFYNQVSGSCQTIFIEAPEAISDLKFKGASVYGSGVAAADFNDDGFVDLFVPSEGGTVNAIFRNESGQFVKTDLLNSLTNARAGLWLDFDADGLLDLLVAGDCFQASSNCSYASVTKLFRQTINGAFSEVTLTLPTNTLSKATVLGGMACGDLNNDGLLDILITYWNGSPLLLMNHGDGQFLNLTDGFTLPLDRYWQPIIYDFNEDGWADIFFTVDKGANLFFLNNQDGSFSESASKYGINASGYDMGVSIRDFDNDLDVDLYVTNIFGGGFHSMLFDNQLSQDGFSFLEISGNVGVRDTGWGWGNTALDADLDGDFDIAATNGWTGEYVEDRSRLFINNQNNFYDAISTGGFNDTNRAVSLISFDADRDGDPDMIQTLLDNDIQQGIRYFQNNSVINYPNRNYIVVKPRMLGKNKFATGTKVDIHFEEQTRTSVIVTGSSFFGQEPYEVFFGLDAVDIIDKVVVTWPGGQRTERFNVTANQVLEITDNDVLHVPVIKKITTSNGTFNFEIGHMSTYEEKLIIQKDTSPEFTNPITFDLMGQAWSDPNPEPGIIYYYRTGAVADRASSDWSQTQPSIWNPIILVNSPMNLSSHYSSKSRIDLTWVDASTNETSFEIQRSTSAEFRSFISRTVGGDVESYVDTSLEPATTYFYRIRALHSESNSGFSNTLTACSCDPLNTQIQDFSIFPNPTTNIIYVLSHLKGTSQEFHLMSLDGQTVLSVNLANEKTNSVNISKLSAGTYIFQITHPYISSISGKIVIY